MPNEYWLRGEGIGRDALRTGPRDVEITSIELGPGGGTRQATHVQRPPQGNYAQPLQGASATGGPVATSRRSRFAGGTPDVPAANAMSVAHLGVRANAREAHTNRASSMSGPDHPALAMRTLLTTVGDGCPGVAPWMMNGCTLAANEVLG
jgi:hypothetical protein